MHMPSFVRRGSATVVLLCANILAFSFWRTTCSSSEKFQMSNPCDVDFRNKIPELMRPSEIMRYIYWTNSSACRIGHDFGGKFYYEMGDAIIDGQKTICMDRQLLTQRPCLVYSFGINNEWSFDESMERFGCQVYSFDPSMDQQNHDHTPNIHFYRIGLGDENTQTANGWQLRTLNSVYDMLKSKHGSVPIDVLKLDVEHTEWIAIPQLLKSNAFDRVRQLAIDIHIRNGLNFVEIFRLYVKVLRSLEDYGMVRFANRPNMFVSGDLLGRSSYVAFELSFYNTRFVLK